MGAVLGTIVFDVIAAAIFPLANTAQPISTTWPSRLLARLMVTDATAVAVMLSMSGSRANKNLPRAGSQSPTEA
jgi:hypothetical protein